MKIQKKGDWAYYRGDEFIKFTWRHKVRLFLGVNGQHHDGRYTFSVPKWGKISLQKKMYSFMYYIGNPLLNFVIGFKRIR